METPEHSSRSAEEDYIDSLWADWVESPSDDLRNVLFSAHFEWLKKVVTRVFSKYKFPSVEWSDCLQYSSLALLESIERFDPLRGVPFKNFVYKRIEGAILNGAYRESRLVGKSSGTTVPLEWLDGEDVQDGDALDTLVGYVLDVAYDTLLSSGAVSEVSGRYNPYDAYVTFRQEGMIRDLLGLLDEPDRTIMRMYYLESISFKTVAIIQGCSSSRVSQIHRRALRKIRELYEKNY